MPIEAIAAFADNYIWAIHGPDAQTWLVDPGDAAACKAALAATRRQLAGILVTHHHADHTGGIAELAAADLPVYGPANSPFAGIRQPLTDGDTLTLPIGRLQILAVPGHTLDHIAYFAEAGTLATEPVLFCGDTLFAAGCGRLFEGTAAMMLDSLERLAALPPETRIYCAHEYTLSNLRFALAVEPANNAIHERERQVQALRTAGRPSLPSRLADELATNPFLRTAIGAVQAQAERQLGRPANNRIEAFAAIRQWKDRF